MSLDTMLMAQVEAGGQENWRLRWDWDWPLWATMLMIAAAVAWVIAIYLRESSSAGRGMRSVLAMLRLSTIALAALMLVQPRLEWFSLGRPRLVVVADKSASMATFDLYPGADSERSRVEAWQTLLVGGEQPLLAEWQSTYDLDVVAFDDQVIHLDENESTLIDRLKEIKVDEQEAVGTRLGDAIDFALRELPGSPPVAVVVLTDGIGTMGQPLQQAAQQARRMRIPLHTVAIGSERRRPDVAVENLVVEEVVFPGDRLQVEATIRATGYEGETVDVLLRDAESTVLASTTIDLPADDVTETVSLAIRPSAPGRMPLELGIQPLADENDSRNNQVRQVIEVRDEKIRVLLVQNQPSYEYRALKSLLERDPAVELKVLLQEADAEYAAVDDVALRAFPSREDELFQFDVLMVGDVDASLLPRSVWPLAERFVSQNGGGFVGIAGPRFMPLAFRGNRSLLALLPIDLELLNPLRSQLGGAQSFAIYPTALGWRTPSLQLGDTREQSQQIWAGLPKVNWLLRIDQIKPGAQVLAECAELTNRQGQRLPVILRHYVGAGEVLFHATDETWRWRWRTDDRYFARYWGQVVRRLGRGRLAAGRQGVQLTADRAIYKPGEPIQLQARFRNPSSAPTAADGVIVQLQGRAGPPKQVALQRRLGHRGMFTTSVEQLPAGEYEAQIVRPDRAGAGDVARFAVRQPPRELARVVVNRTELREVAELTGGKFYTIDDAAQLSEQLPPPREQTIQERPPQKLWNSHFVVALLVVLLSSEWLLRRRYGML